MKNKKDNYFFAGIGILISAIFVTIFLFKEDRGVSFLWLFYGILVGYLIGPWMSDRGL